VDFSLSCTCQVKYVVEGTRAGQAVHQQVKLTAAGQLDRYLLPATFRCESEARDKAPPRRATQRAASRNTTRVIPADANYACTHLVAKAQRRLAAWSRRRRLLWRLFAIRLLLARWGRRSWLRGWTLSNKKLITGLRHLLSTLTIFVRITVFKIGKHITFSGKVLTWQELIIDI